MILPIHIPPARPHTISRLCDDPFFWRTQHGCITCVCEEKKR